MTSADERTAAFESADRPGVPGPTFLVIGAGKAGTTTLHSLLDELPDVFMTTPKELQYFNHPVDPAHPLSWYYSFFEAGAGYRHRGESSPTYTMFPTIRDVPARIHAMNPDIRLIYMVREPVSRMVSAYAQSRRMGYEFRSIEDALLSELTYTTTSCYALQLSEYLRFFELEQIHVEDLADLAADPAGVVDRIAHFLGVPSIEQTAAPVKNPTNRLAVRRSYGPILRRFRERGMANSRWQKRVQRSWFGSTRLDADVFHLDKGLATELRRTFLTDIEALEDMLGRSFAHWRDS